MIKVAYNDIQSKIKINGLLSDPFTLMQGVRQECPLPMVLYITAYVFANFIDTDKGIQGIQIRDHEMKLVNFADEILLSRYYLSLQDASDLKAISRSF